MNPNFFLTGGTAAVGRNLPDNVEQVDARTGLGGDQLPSILSSVIPSEAINAELTGGAYPGVKCQTHSTDDEEAGEWPSRTAEKVDSDHFGSV